MRRGVGALFVAFLAVRIFLGPVSTPSQSPSSSQQPKATKTPPSRVPPAAGKKTAEVRVSASGPCETSSEKCPGKGLLDAVHASLSASTPKSDLASLWNVSEDVKNAHFLIATVPDPVHTHLSLLFDRQVAAIEQAVQQAGYLFSRAYLPWDNAQHPEDTSYSVRLGQQDYQASREEYPGLLVFHNAEKINSKYPGLRPLFVFLVAETPTGGINKDQFSTALTAIQDICSKGCADPTPADGEGNLFILGPTFSGSLYSLHAIVMEMGKNGNYPGVTIHSGTATDNDTIQWFNHSTAGFRKKEFPKDDPRGAAVQFQSFQKDSRQALDRVLDFACSQGYQPDKIAVLSEDETAYGNVFRPANLPGANAPRTAACSENAETRQGRVLRLNFPRDFSALRNAYQRDLEASASPSGAPRSTLRLNLEDEGNDDDSVASFSPGQTPLSEEAIMMGIVTNLREQKINLVVIEATSPLDIVFLVRYLRVADPDARIVTLNTEMLLPRQVDDPHLRGVMQFVSYPLVPGLDDGTAGVCGKIPQVFPSDDSAGTFLATLSLLKAQGSAYDCFQYEAASADSGATDRLWLTVLGRDQFWPVGEYGTSPINYPHPGEPAPWIVLCTSAVAFAVIYALIAFQGSVISASIFLANFATVKDPWRDRTILFCGLVIFDTFFCLLWPRFWIVGHAKCFVVLILLGVAGLVMLDLCRRSQWRPKPDLLITGFVSFVGSFVVLVLAFKRDAEPLQQFLRYRYEHASSGVSPVVPFFLLFAGCLWTCWHSLSGRPPWDCNGSGPPLPTGAQVVAGDGQDSRQRLAGLTAGRNQELVNLMKTGSFHWRILVLTVASFAVPMLTMTFLASPHTVQSFESVKYNRTYTVFLILAIALVLWDTFRLSFIWLELRRLLMVLDRLPLRRGFVRMAGFRSKRMWQLGGNTFEDFFAVMSMELQTISALKNSKPPDEKCGTALETAQKAVTALGKWMREQKKTEGVNFTHRLVEQLTGLQNVLTGTCAATLQYLRGAWDQEARPVWDAECMVKEKTACQDLGLPLSVRLAEDFVCLFYFNFISCVFTRMRALVLAIAGMYVFILLSFSSYPFEPSSAFHSAMIFLLILITGAVAIVSAQAHKDATISRITDTDVGKLGFDFWFRLIATMGVPLLSLLAAKFPEIGGFLFSWLEPASQAFK
jgi:hypothetical protein